jgi:hypothetical protein
MEKLRLICSTGHVLFPRGSLKSTVTGTRLDATLTDKLFITTYIQYNQQADNMNINARFQCRYKPVSDLFIVYTDNYFPEYMAEKNRALVLKVSYWFN